MDTPLDPEARVRAIRARLPGQQAVERIETARLNYGTLYTLAEIQSRAAEALPMRLGYARRATLEPLEAYRGFISDEAVIKYDEAAQSGLFSHFWVLTPLYGHAAHTERSLAARVKDSDLCAIVAHWQVPADAQSA